MTARRYISGFCTCSSDFFAKLQLSTYSLLEKTIRLKNLNFYIYILNFNQLFHIYLFLTIILINFCETFLIYVIICRLLLK